MLLSDFLWTYSRNAVKRRVTSQTLPRGGIPKSPHGNLQVIHLQRVLRPFQTTQYSFEVAGGESALGRAVKIHKEDTCQFWRAGSDRQMCGGQNSALLMQKSLMNCKPEKKKKLLLTAWKGKSLCPCMPYPQWASTIGAQLSSSTSELGIQVHFHFSWIQHRYGARKFYQETALKSMAQSVIRGFQTFFYLN